MELPAGRAARVLGCSVRAVRRRSARGELASRRDKRGRLWVTLPDQGGRRSGRLRRPALPSLLRTALQQLESLREEHAALLQQLERDALDRYQLRRLIESMQMQLDALPEHVELRDSDPAAGRALSGIRESKRGLGASLTITGVAALLAGIVLHFALQMHALDTAVHLGYIIGLVGLLSFLLGLLLVF